jgi:NAD(P)-dependent dehydrogenase (short-subunit alcohol dehydrogenase family)
MAERSVAIVTGGSRHWRGDQPAHDRARSRGRAAGTRPAGLFEPDAACDQSGPKRALPPRRPPRRQKFVARAVMFFTARGNTFITGQVLYVRGGTRAASISF